MCAVSATFSPCEGSVMLQLLEHVISGVISIIIIATLIIKKFDL